MTTYEEALIDVRKLKELAETEAKNTILEAVSPMIKSMIAKEVSNLSSPLFEEEDLLTAQPAAVEVQPMPTPEPAVAPPSPSLDVAPEEVPIKVNGPDAMNMPLPGPDGKLVVDFDDLFLSSDQPAAATGDSALPTDVPAAPEQPIPVAATGAEQPVAPIPPEATPPVAAVAPEQPLPPQEPQPMAEEPVTYEMFKEKTRDLALRMEKVFARKSIPSLIKEALQDKIFQLYEQLENLAENGIISENVQKLNENRLEFLYQYLKEANVDNTYNKNIQKEQTEMKTPSLKEFAAAMLDQDGSAGDTLPAGDVTSPADSHQEEKPLKVRSETGQDATEKKTSDHAMKATEPTVTLKTLEEELKEALAAEPGKEDLAGAASTIPDKAVGDVEVTKSTSTDKPVEAAKVTLQEKEETVEEEVVYEVDDKELAEAVRSLKKESIVKQIRALKESLANMAIAECGMGMEEEMAGGVPGPVAGGMKPAMGEDVEVNFNFDLSDLEGLENMAQGGGMGHVDLGGGDDVASDDDSIEIVDDEQGADMSAPSLSMGGDEEGSEVDDDSDALSMVAETKKEKMLKARLLESELWNAKVMYANKFLQREDLSKKQKQKIVEYLDNAKTLNEAKTIYGRIKSLTESAKKKVSSGASQVVSSGAAKIQEQAEKPASSQENLYENATLEESSKQRLMELAGIKRKG